MDKQLKLWIFAGVAGVFVLLLAIAGYVGSVNQARIAAEENAAAEAQARATALRDQYDAEQSVVDNEIAKLVKERDLLGINVKRATERIRFLNGMIANTKQSEVITPTEAGARNLSEWSGEIAAASKTITTSNERLEQVKKQLAQVQAKSREILDRFEAERQAIGGPPKTQ